MERYKDIKWSEVARQAFQKKISEIDLDEKILIKNKLTEKDIDEIAHKVNKEVFKELNSK